MSRTKEEIRDRSKLIRAAIPDCLEELFEMQNRICDLCGHLIQDIVLAELDHSISVKYFASELLLIEEAISQANDLKNLRAVHYSCNSAKKDMSRDDWYRQGLNNREKNRLFSEVELHNFKERLRLSGLKGGKIRGRQATERGEIQKIGRLYGPENGRNAGRIAVERGQIQELGRNKSMESRIRDGRKGGFETVKRGYFDSDHIKNKETCAKGGRAGGPIAGRIAVESGQLSSIQTFENRSKAGQKNIKTGHIKALGLMQGHKNVESGLAQRLPHIRWHVSKGIIKEGCKFCEELKNK